MTESRLHTWTPPAPSSSSLHTSAQTASELAHMDRPATVILLFAATVGSIACGPPPKRDTNPTGVDMGREEKKETPRERSIRAYQGELELSRENFAMASDCIQASEVGQSICNSARSLCRLEAETCNEGAQRCEDTRAALRERCQTELEGPFPQPVADQ